MLRRPLPPTPLSPGPAPDPRPRESVADWLKRGGEIKRLDPPPERADVLIDGGITVRSCFGQSHPVNVKPAR